MGKIGKTYSKDFKLKAVQLYLSGEQGYKTLTTDLGISDPNLILSQIRGTVQFLR